MVSGSVSFGNTPCWFRLWLAVLRGCQTRPGTHGEELRCLDVLFTMISILHGRGPSVNQADGHLQSRGSPTRDIARCWNPKKYNRAVTMYNFTFDIRNSIMFASMFRLTFCAGVLSVLCFAASVQADDAKSKWTSLFDGKTLNGWEKVGNEKSVWEVKDGAISGSGPASMLVSTTKSYKNFRYRAEIKINDGGNSGLYFRTTAKPGFSDGYEAQIDSTHTDPIRTGSLYGFCHVYKQHVKPDTWFKYDLEVRDDVWRGRKVTRIKVTVDGNELYEYLDFAMTFKSGHFAFQHHDPDSIVSIRKVEVMPLAD
jgi:hypothetical protein